MSTCGGKRTCKYYKTCGSTENCKRCSAFVKIKSTANKKGWKQ